MKIERATSTIGLTIITVAMVISIVAARMPRPALAISKTEIISTRVVKFTCSDGVTSYPANPDFNALVPGGKFAGAATGSMTLPPGLHVTGTVTLGQWDPNMKTYSIFGLVNSDTACVVPGQIHELSISGITGTNVPITTDQGYLGGGSGTVTASHGNLK